MSDYGYDTTRHAFDKATGKLGVEQTDLLMLHQPAPLRFDLTIAAYQGAGVTASRWAREIHWGQ